MKVGIIGCGLIGRKRALSLADDDVLVACCDTNIKLGAEFAQEFNCKYFMDYTDLITVADCNVIIVAVINKYAKEIVEFALESGKHVLVEKPMGINYEESVSMFDTSFEYKKVLNVGFNHKFHPAISRAKSLIDTIGKIMFICGHYGHGGRPGMENEWRASKDLCGGGELLDQGVHLIDLSRWFAGEIKSVFGKVSTKFWNIEVEDNAFIQLQSVNDVDIQLHVSWTNWKNSFSFEIFGTKGYIKINGLGRSYGKETLEIGIRKEEGGVPDIQIHEFEEEDNSWYYEWLNFKYNIMDYEKNESINHEIINDAMDGLKVNEIIDAIYESSSKNKVIEII